LIANGRGGDQQVRIGSADDYERADGVHVMTYWQAAEAARKLVRGTDTGDKPMTVGAMLEQYREDLIARGGDKANVGRVKKHLPPSLVGKPVALVGGVELQMWKRAMLGALKESSVRRIARSICAAVTLAEKLDARIKNGDAWREAFAGLQDSGTRNLQVLGDADVHRVVAVATALDLAFGLFITVLAHTGCRPSQAGKLSVGDFQDGKAPRLMMPASRKGRGKPRHAQPVPISVDLAHKLKVAAKGRAASAPLLTKADGTPWGTNDHWRPFGEVAERLGLSISVYCLRHSAITRALLKNVPVRIVATLSDTSVAMIEKTYSKYIAHHADELARHGFLGPPPANEDNVVPLR
jgi:integrase